MVAAEASKVYGDDDPDFTAEVLGLLGEDTADLIDFTLSRSAGEDAIVHSDGFEPQESGYAITPAGQTIQGNYRVEYQPASFTIEPREVEVTSASATKVYDGSALTAPSAEVTSKRGFQAGEVPTYDFTGE